jgi:hypothetical protein
VNVPSPSSTTVVVADGGNSLTAACAPALHAPSAHANAAPAALMFSFMDLFPWSID